MPDAWDYETIRTEVVERMKSIADEQGIECGSIEDQRAIVDDLGFSSLDVAVLVSHLEKTFGVDPFATNNSAATEIRTVEDVCMLYERTLSDADTGVSPEDGEVLRARSRRATPR